MKLSTEAATPETTTARAPMRSRERARTKAKERLRVRRDNTLAAGASSGCTKAKSLTRGSSKSSARAAAASLPQGSAAGRTLKAVMLAAASASIGAGDGTAKASVLSNGVSSCADLGVAISQARGNLQSVLGKASGPNVTHVPPSHTTHAQAQQQQRPLGVRTVAGPAGMKAVIAPPLSRSVGNLSATAEALLPDLHRKLTPLIPNDPNDAGVEAVRRRYPGRRPCIGDLVRLLPGRRIRSSLLEVMTPGELAEIMDDSPDLVHVPFHVKGPRGALAFAGTEDIEVVRASSKQGRPAGTDAAYWLSRVDQIHEEWRERTTIAHHNAKAEHRDSAAMVMMMMDTDEDATATPAQPVGRTVQLVDGRVATVIRLSEDGWLRLRTADGELLEAFYTHDGRPLSVQLAAYPPLPLVLPFGDASSSSSSSSRLQQCPLAAAVAAARPMRPATDDEDASSEHGSTSGYGSDAVSQPGSPSLKVADKNDSLDACWHGSAEGYISGADAMIS
jgi:hypothetical protein